MVSLDNLTEGYFVRTDEDLIFEIKGDIHPQGRLIAYLRYVPVDDNYRKIYDLHERASYLERFYPHYLWYSEAHGRVVQSIPVENVKEILSPVDCLASLRDSDDKSELVRATINLVDALVKTSGIDHMCIGITGSILAGLATVQSDIDLVVYGEHQCRILHSRLGHSFEVTPDMHPYSGNRLSQHVQFRWPELAHYQDILKSIEQAKLLQGVYCDTDFFIRLVKLRSESGHVYGEEIVRTLGVHQMQCRINASVDSIFTPCVYGVDNDSSLVGVTRLISYRGRFTEHAFQGDVVNVRGRLELVKNLDSGREYFQVVLGEDYQDFMLPV